MNLGERNREVRVFVNENGRVVLPASFRKALEIQPGDEVILRLEEGEVRVATVKSRLKRAQELVRPYLKPEASMADELIADRREAARRDE